MAAMVAAMAMPAFAKNYIKLDGGPPLLSGNPEKEGGNLVFHCNAFEGGKGVAVFNDDSGEPKGNCRFEE
jgi:hypothetical protein